MRELEKSTAQKQKGFEDKQFYQSGDYNEDYTRTMRQETIQKEEGYISNCNNAKRSVIHKTRKWNKK